MAQNNIHGQKEVEEIVKTWGELNSTVSATIDLLLKYKNVTTKLPSEFFKYTGDIKKQQQDLSGLADETRRVTLEEKQRIRTVKALEAEKAKQKDAPRIKQLKEERELTRELTKTDKQREREKARLVKQMEREERAIAKTQGLYNVVQQRVSALTKQYNDLAARKELNGRLTQSELQELKLLEVQLNKYQNTLKRVDANIGKHQRNVGNYKSGFDGLGFSVAQLSREMPAFANSMQTGFMAISNNIPMLVDEINKLKVANRELAATGKPTVSIFKKLGGAIFGWQTLISIGVTLLTVYGAKLFELATGLTEAEKAAKKEREELEKQNEEIRKNIKLRKEQIDVIKGYTEDSKIAGITLISSLSKGLDDIANGVLKGVDAEAFLLEFTERLKDSNLENLDSLKNQNISLEKRARIARVIIDLEEARATLDADKLKSQDKLAKLEQDRFALVLKGNDTTRIDNDIQKIRESRNEKILKLRSKEVLLQRELNSLLETGTGKEKVSTIKVEQLELEQKGYKSTRLEMEKFVAQLKELQSLYIKNSEEYIALGEQIKFIEDALNVDLSDGSDAILNQIELTEKWEKQLAKLRVETDKFIESFSSGFFQNAGLGSLNQFFDGTFDKLLAGAETLEEKFAVHFNAIAEVGQEAFNFINQFGQENFDAQYRRLEQQKEIALQFAGDSASGREEIERQYEEKRAEIQRRQAEAEKKQAIFNIVIDTAQGIVSALASTPPNIPLSIAIGAIGAAQAAIVASQQIPQFKDGVRDFGGGLAIVGDGGVSEVITTPEGKAYKTPNKDTLVNLPKGANVYKNYGEFQADLDRMLSMNGIENHKQHLPSIKIEQGLSKEDFVAGIGRLEKTIANGKGGAIHFDEYGFRKFLTHKNGKTQLLNNRVSFKGKGV